jgi:segregation and condensation protein B
MEKCMTKEPKETPNIEQRTANEEQADLVQDDLDSRSPLARGQVYPCESRGGNDKEGDMNVENEATVESVIEAVLFASDEPLSEARLASIVQVGVKQIRRHIESLNAKYKANNHAFQIEEIAGGYQMLTLSTYNHWLQKLLRARSDSKLSPAALETLAIIAYKQPIMRADIEAIRGVAAGELIRNLMYKGLVKIVGRAEVLGRPMLHGTTKKFLEVFGLNSLKDLPKVEELKKPPS